MRKLALSFLAIIGIAGHAQVATASPQLSGLEAFGTKVADEDLADMRGKFITPNNVTYFGIEMQTSWLDADGITTHATLLFSVNFADAGGSFTGGVPALYVEYSRSGDESLDVAGFQGAASDGYVALGQGPNTGGALQSQLIAGSDNQVLNSLGIAIVPANGVPELDHTGMINLTGSRAISFDDGDTIGFELSSNRIGLSMTANSDFTSQSFDGIMGQAAQQVSIASDHNHINNRMQIMIGHDQLANSSLPSVQNSLEIMRGTGL